jgi:hypothetical protein
MLKIERRVLDIVAEREEQNSPGSTATLEYRSMLLSSQVPPFVNVPGMICLTLDL